MCEACGCGDTNLVPVELQQSLMAHNDHGAAHNREHFLAAGVTAINLMGSPGSGKTAVLEATARAAGDRWKVGAVSADLATDNDAERLNAAGIPSRSITTGQACHLDADLVHHALHDFPWRDTDLFFIENVGNLVCPAIYDLGQMANVVTLAVTEGEDKPLKYPVMFRKADLVLLTKVDLLPALPQVEVARIEDALARTMPDPKMIQVSGLTGDGIGEWMAWLEAVRSQPRPAARLAHDHDHGHDHQRAGDREGHPHGH